MKKILCILFFLPNLITFAQGGWQKKILVSGSSASLARNVVECPNGDFIAIGITVDKVNNVNIQRLTLVATDPQGNMLWKKSYGTSKFAYYDNYVGGSIAKDNSGFYHAVCVDSGGRAMGALLKFDYNGDTLWQKVYRNSALTSIIPHAFCRSEDGGFLITGGGGYVGGASGIVIIKTDGSGTEIWLKHHTKADPSDQLGLSIVQDSVTKKIIVAGTQLNLNASSSIILILDNSGNKITQKSYNGTDGGPFNGLIQLRDKNFLTCGAQNAHNKIGSLDRYYQAAVKFDINGNVIWSKTYDVIAAHTDLILMHELPDGDIILVGRIDTLTNSKIGTRQRIKIYKTDKDGNLKWARYVGDATGYGEWPRSMNATSDGGFILTAGQVLEHINTPYNLIKIDANGCDTLEAWCKSVELSFDELKIIDYGLKIYPNPVSEILNVECEILNDKTELSIINLYGREVKRVKLTNDKQINVGELSTGIYFLQVFEKGKLLTTQKIMKE